MLQSIRDRAHGIMAWVILISIVVPFAMWGIQNYLDVGKEKPVATVDGKELFERDVNRAAEQDLSGLVGLEESDEKAIRRQALDRLIREQLVRKEAERLHLAIGDNELRAFVQSLPYFQTDGQFDKDKYKMVMTSQGLDANGYAAQVRSALTMDQLQNGVARSAFLTPQEVDQFLRLKNQQRSIQYVAVPVASKRAVEPSAEAVEAYYNQHPQEFSTPERVSVQYVELSLDQVAARSTVTDDELKAYYEEQKTSFSTPERRKVSHILIAVAPGADEAAYQAALDKAKQLKQRLDTNGDFAALAKEASDDKLSAVKGGDLGLINHGQMDKNFEDAAYQLQSAGSVSEPVKTSFGYHLIKLTELTPGSVKPFESVKAELSKTYLRNNGEKQFYELGEKLSQLGFEQPGSLEPAAEALGVSVQSSELFSQDQGAGVADNEAFRKAAFSPDVLEGRNSEPVELAADRVVMLRLKDRVAAARKPLADVRAQIVEQLRFNTAHEAAKAQAQTLLTAVQGGQRLEDAAKAAGLSVQSPKPFDRDANGADAPIELVVAAFRMGHPAQLPLTQLSELGNQDPVVLSLTAVTDGDVTKLSAEEKQRTLEMLVRSRGMAEFSAVAEHLQQSAEVEIAPSKE